METRRRGVSFHKDEQGETYVSGTFRVVNAAVAFFVQLAVLLGFLWAALELKMVPLIDQRIDLKDSSVVEKADRALAFALEHRIEAQAALRDFSDYKDRNGEDLRRIYDELRYIRETLDGRPHRGIAPPPTERRP